MSASYCAIAERSPRPTSMCAIHGAAPSGCSLKWWTVGYLVAALAYALHVGALALASLSLVQAVLAGGLVLLGGDRRAVVRLHLGRRREWLGVGLATVGLAFLALTGGGDSE